MSMAHGVIAAGWARARLITRFVEFLPPDSCAVVRWDTHRDGAPGINAA